MARAVHARLLTESSEKRVAPAGLYATNHANHQFEDVVGRKLNLGCGPDVRDKEAGWVNMDAYYRHPEVVLHDMTTIPWPFEDESFDLAYASHVLEHIPPAPGHDPLLQVMEEMWRILKVGGTACIRVPWGGTHAARAHIQHYRHFLPEHFYYFEPEHAESYLSPAKFRVERWARTRAVTGWRWPYRPMIRGLSLSSHLDVRLPFLRRLLTVPSELEVRLRKLPRENE